jgi:hypothetical protein
MSEAMVRENPTAAVQSLSKGRSFRFSPVWREDSTVLRQDQDGGVF